MSMERMIELTRKERLSPPYLHLEIFMKKLDACKTWPEWTECMLACDQDTKDERLLLLLRREREADANGGRLPL